MESEMWREAPFDLETIRLINRFQKDGRFDPIKCSCGAKVYAVEEGLKCGECFEVTQRVPAFVALGGWNLFANFKHKESNGDN